MKRHLMAATAAFALLVPAAVAQTSSDTSSGAATMEMTNLTAEQFVAMAASSNMFEIESSEAALAKDDDMDDDVEEFAQEMVTDHTAAGEKMMQVATAAGVTPPTSMMEKHQQMLTELNAVSDDDAFEAAYVDAQVMAHEEAVALFTAYAENGDNPELKAFAAETLPTLQEHLEEVQDLDEDS